MNERQIFLLLLYSFLILVVIEIFYFGSSTSHPERVILILSGLGYLGYHTSYKWNNKFYPQDFGNDEIVWSNVLIYAIRYVIVIATLTALILISVLIYNNIGIILRILTLIALFGFAIGFLLFSEDASKELKIILPSIAILIGLILMYRWSFLDSVLVEMDFIINWGKLIFVIALAILAIYLLFDGHSGWFIPVVMLLIAIFLGSYWSFYEIPFFGHTDSNNPSIPVISRDSFNTDAIR
jgi:hypothetical protein